MHKQMFVSLLFAQRTIQSAMRKKRAKNKIDLEEKIQKCKKNEKESHSAKAFEPRIRFYGVRNAVC